MYSYRNEDAAWDRLIDVQREMENSRLWADSSGNLLATLARLAGRARILGGLAKRRAPQRRRPVHE
jgi:hypothetical protein